MSVMYSVDYREWLDGPGKIRTVVRSADVAGIFSRSVAESVVGLLNQDQLDRVNAAEKQDHDLAQAAMAEVAGQFDEVGAALGVAPLHPPVKRLRLKEYRSLDRVPAKVKAARGIRVYFLTPVVS